MGFADNKHRVLQFFTVPYPFTTIRSPLWPHHLPPFDPMNATSQTHLWLIDTHVHLYDCFEPGEFFNAAWQNFYLAAQQFGHAEAFSGILLFTECRVDNAFQSLCRRAVEGTQDDDPRWRGWHFQTIADDPRSLLVQRDQAKLWVVAGRQIITAEKLEVLALISDARFDDGQPLDQCLRTVVAHDAIPVIPWGAGKWWGQRGRLLSQILDAGVSAPLYLGDNGGRPGLWAQPRHFVQARQAGVAVLPGSDPLPLPWDARRVGSRGLALGADSEPTAPGEQLRERLRETALQYRPFGGPLANTRFFINQMSLRMHKQHSATRMVDG